MGNPGKAADARERARVNKKKYWKDSVFEMPQHTVGTHYCAYSYIMKLLENGATPVSLNVCEDGMFRHTVEFNGARYINVSWDEIRYRTYGKSPYY